MGKDYVIALLLTWLIGIVLLVLFIWGAIHFTLRKKYIRAGICWFVLFSTALTYVYDRYQDNKQTELYKRLDKPAKNSLIVNPNFIPKFLAKKFEQFTGFESVSSYVHSENLKSGGRPPVLVVSFDLFNDFQKDCKNFKDLNTFVYGKDPSEIIELKSKKKVNFYKNNDKNYQTMKLFMEDHFGCLEIFTENLSSEITKEDLLSILNSMIRVQ